MRRFAVVIALFAATLAWPAAQTHGAPEEFTAVAMRADNLATAAGNVQVQVTRWSTEAERARLVTTLQQKGADALLEALRDMPSAGTIKTPDTLAYDLRFAHQAPGEDGGRRIVVATDRQIGFWEASRALRTLDYPFTVIQMQIDREGMGRGTLSIATQVTARGNTIELENFTSSPVMLTRIEARPLDR